MGINVNKVIQGLVLLGRPNLAKIVNEAQDKTIEQYIADMVQDIESSSASVDSLFLSCLNEHLSRLGYKNETILPIVNHLNRNGWLQTAPHAVAVQNPRMTSITHQTVLATQKRAPALIAWCSTIPFANSYLPDRVWGDNCNVSLVPSKMQDLLVYKATMPSKTIDQWRQEVVLQKWYVDPSGFEYYADWLAVSVAKQESTLLSAKVVFVDLNELAHDYLIQALAQKNHPIAHWWSALSGAKNYPNVAWWSSLYQGKRRKKTEKLYLREAMFAGKHGSIDINNHKALEQLHPSTWLTYTLLEVFAGVTTLGSFIHSEYLPRFFAKWQQLELLPKSAAYTTRLTTGELPGLRHKNTLDWLISGQLPVLSTDTKMKDILSTSFDVMTDKYWTNELTTLS